MKADGSDVVQLTSHAGFNGNPEYPRMGQRLAFESDRGVGFPLQGIYFMNASDGSNVQRVSFPSDKEFDTEPHFSPDGTRVAFTRKRNCNGRVCIAAIYVATLGGTGLTRITQWGQDTGGMDWSPDGTKVVYNTSNDRYAGRIDIFVANADGSHPVNLTNNGAISARCPVELSWRAKWSPDSTKFVFLHADCVNGPSLWLMNADGSGKHQLTGPFTDTPTGYESELRRLIEIAQATLGARRTS